MSDSQDKEFDGYLATAIAGDRSAIERVLRTIRPLVVRYCRAKLGRSERTYASADDVAQEVCMAVLTSLSTYRDQGRPFLAFVYGIAAHKVIDAYRAAGRNKSQPLSDVLDSTLDDGPEQHVLLFESPGRTIELMDAVLDEQGDMLASERANYVDSLTSSLDIEAGLTHALGVASLRRTTRRLEQTLDVQAGLEAALAQMTRANPPASGGTSATSTTADSGNDELMSKLAAAARGDSEAKKAVESVIRPVVMRYCHIELGRGARAETLTSQICTAVLASLTTYRNRDAFFDYVVDVAAHRVIDAHLAEIEAIEAARINTRASVQDRVVDGPEQRALTFESAGEMGRLLEVLPEKQREILILRVVYRLSSEETAETVGSTPGAVRVAQHRALNRLRKAMSEGR